MANSKIFKGFVALVLVCVWLGLISAETFCLLTATLVGAIFGSVSAWVKGAVGRFCFIIARAASTFADYLAFNMGEQHKVCINRYRELTAKTENV